jgi:hypothetical protein
MRARNHIAFLKREKGARGDRLLAHIRMDGAFDDALREKLPAGGVFKVPNEEYRTISLYQLARIQGKL